MSGDVPRRRIGVLVELFAGGEWAPHGLARLMGFLIEGAAASGRLTFELVVPEHARARVLADLRELHATEGVDWRVHSTGEALPFPLLPIENHLVDGMNLAAPDDRVRPVVRVAHPQAGDPVFGRVAERVLRLAERDRAGAERLLGKPRRRAVQAFLLFDRITRAVLRRLRPRRPGRVEPVVAAPGLAPVTAPAAQVVQRDAQLAGAFHHLLSQLAETRLLPGRLRGPLRDTSDRLLHSLQHRYLDRLAAYAARHVTVDGWLVFAPATTAGRLLPEPKAALLAGMGGFVFPETMPGAIIAADMANTQRQTEIYKRIIVFSAHVAEREMTPLYGVAPERLHVVRHAPVDIARVLPFLPADRRPTADSRRQAAEILRRHAAERGWEYLHGFPFEEVDYLVVSTQDRPYKNLIVVAEAMRRLVQRDGRNIKLLMTARLPSPEHSATARLIRDHGLGFDIVGMPLLPREVHAALYHCALAAVHPSLWEGGTGAWPLDEANSLGVPALVAESRAVRELVAAHGGADYVFAPHEPEALVALVHHVADNREAVRSAQLATYAARQGARSWTMAAEEYANAVMGRAGEQN